jgi:hypothetical protein
MTLSEIETILEELAARHPNLTADLLTTMLLAAGWENKNIQDAVILFKRDAGKRKAPVVTLSAPVKSDVIKIPSSGDVSSVASSETDAKEVVSVSKEDMTFYLPDGTEEGDLHVYVNEPVFSHEEKKEVVVEKIPEPLPQEKEQHLSSVEVSSETENLQDISKQTLLPQEENNIPSQGLQEQKNRKSISPSSMVTATPVPTISLKELPQLTSSPETESLVVADKPKSQQKPNHIPEDLPLIPFESSPHIWSFARYKNVFHADTVPEEEVKAIEKRFDDHLSQVSPQSVVQKIVVMPTQQEHVTDSDNEVEEILLEKTPMTKEDESLVFLAGLMLLAIILILGYMYSHGRL